MKQYTTIDESNCLEYGILLDKGAKLIFENLKLGTGIKIGKGSILAGSTIALGDNLIIEDNCEIRSTLIEIGAGSEIGRSVRVLSADYFCIGIASRVSYNCNIFCRSFKSGKFLYMAQDCSVGYGGTGESTAIVSIGDNVALGPYNILNANVEIVLKTNVGSGSNVTFWTHGFHFGHSALDGFFPEFKPIIVEENVWLGFHVTLLPGATIGGNSIIASGSVVTKNIPANCLAGGIPSKVIKELNIKPIENEVAVDFVISVFKNWLEELVWKGVNIISEGTTENFYFYAVVLFADNHPIRISFLRTLHSLPPHVGRQIFLTLDKRDDIRNNLRQEETLFEFKSRMLTGISDEISEDLRDYFRRRTLGCGNEKLFSSIEPAIFKHLKKLT